MTGVWSRPGAALGLVAAVGVLLIWAGLPSRRRIGLVDRVAPYVRDTPRPSRLLAGAGGDARLVGLLAPLVSELGSRLDAVLGGRESVRRGLQRAGLPADLDRFRAEQVLWGVLGGVGGAVLGTLVWITGGSPLRGMLFIVVGVGIGVVGKDMHLSRLANRREAVMLAEFPTIAELLALSVAAGEGAVGSLDRVTRLSQGELATELGRCLADARAGASLPVALQGLADRTGLPSLTRFVDGIVIAVDRGTPLAEVLRAQAQDVREEGRRLVMEAGGKKEIAMMVPSMVHKTSPTPAAHGGRCRAERSWHRLRRVVLSYRNVREFWGVNFADGGGPSLIEREACSCRSPLPLGGLAGRNSRVNRDAVSAESSC
ncbi:pilus assembly protein TadB [Nostocoides sp. F2B08]|nr:pilus assembly protein TadB [Tetrasphaera sp. F2B08]